MPKTLHPANQYVADNWVTLKGDPNLDPRCDERHFATPLKILKSYGGVPTARDLHDCYWPYEVGAPNEDVKKGLTFSLWQPGTCKLILVHFADDEHPIERARGYKLQ